MSLNGDEMKILSSRSAVEAEAGGAAGVVGRVGGCCLLSVGREAADLPALGATVGTT